MVCWHSSPRCSHGKAWQVRKRRHFESQHWMRFVWQNSKDNFFPLAIQKGGVGTDKGHTLTVFWGGCWSLNDGTVYFWCHMISLPTLLQQTPEILTQNTCLLSRGGISSCCSTLVLLQAGKWQSPLDWWCGNLSKTLGSQLETLYHQRSFFIQVSCYVTAHHTAILTGSHSGFSRS